MRPPRNLLSLVARGRNGGPMKDRRASRGGQRNAQADIMAEAECDYCDGTGVRPGSVDEDACGRCWGSGTR